MLEHNAKAMSIDLSNNRIVHTSCSFFDGPKVACKLLWAVVEATKSGGASLHWREVDGMTFRSCRHGIVRNERISAIDR
jgi:hypothetical protein